MKVSQPAAFFRQAVQMGRLYPLVPVKGDIPITLVIGDNKDYIGFSGPLQPGARSDRNG